jgi:succinate dehydrogenase / fumarate reductase iron-sulfur subunit
MKWKVKFTLARHKAGEIGHQQSFDLEVDPDENVLDGVERIWAFHDRSLTFRHACHHSTCGACGMLVNGVEKLTCITPIHSVTHNGGTLNIEPLRNFPVVSDLVVDMSAFYTRMERTGARQVVPVEGSSLPFEKNLFPSEREPHERLTDCIECGLCISACPIALTDPDYVGPAVLAAAHQEYILTAKPDLLDLVDNSEGLWRCHHGFECTEVCPASVNPAWRIMDLRRRLIGQRIKQIFRPRSAVLENR